jgi:hypothetical protein
VLESKNVELEALVVVEGGSYLEAIDCVWRPGCSGCWIVVYWCFDSEQGQGCLIEIISTVDLILG